jgi:23S rRNA (adenine-N6)-dimethyltransferase
VGVRPRGTRAAAGQHFLRSRSLAKDLVRAAEVSGSDLVLEIGGGTGVLTGALVESGASVVVVERDPALVGVLRDRFGASPSVEIVERDVDRYEWPGRAFVVVANLPFARSGAILARLLRDPNVPLRRAHVIVQWEFAAKHAGVWPSTQRSLYWRAWWDVSIGRRLARSAYAPPPTVDTAVLRFERLTRPALDPRLHERYWSFLTAAFSSGAPMRRGVGDSLSSLEVKRLAPALGFAPDARAWDLDAEQWARLFDFAQGRSAGTRSRS